MMLVNVLKVFVWAVRRYERPVVVRSFVRSSVRSFVHSTTTSYNTAAADVARRRLDHLLSAGLISLA